MSGYFGVHSGRRSCILRFQQRPENTSSIFRGAWDTLIYHLDLINRSHLARLQWRVDVVQIFGTKGRIEIEIPFNAPPNKPCRIFVDDGADPSGRSAEVIEFEIVDQYTIQGDLFSQSIRECTELPVLLEDSIRNMAIIEAVFRSAKTGQWEKLPRLWPLARTAFGKTSPR